MKTKLLVFGITGDLGTRKLLPALETIVETGDFDDLSIIGISRRAVQKEDLITSCKIGSMFCQKISMYSMNLDIQDEYHKLRDYLELQADEQLLIYLAVPPSALSVIVENLGAAGLNDPNVKILFEKPFGIDLESAKGVIGNIERFYKEHQVYRIDHFLAKEMAQNIITFRYRNALFDRIWNKDFIEAIEIVASEKIGIEARVHFYEQIGALRDVTQGHLMQLLALTLMDIPTDFDWAQLPELRFNALSKLKLAEPSRAKRGQYIGYRQEVSNPTSMVETFASIELESTDENWVGVPIKLITGKAMAEKSTEIRIRLKQTKPNQSNQLVFRIQPNEGVEIELFVKKPGYDRSLEAHTLGFSYPEDAELPDAYEQVLVDAISSQKSLFTTGQEVLRSWEVLADVQQHWQTSTDDIISYQSGTDIHII